MKKRVFAFLLAAAMVAGALSACGGPQDGHTAVDSTERIWEGKDIYDGMGYYVMRVGHVQPEDNPRHLSLLQFADDVWNATCGHVEVQVEGNGSLGTEKEILERVLAGQIQGMRGGQYDFSPRLLMFTLPFLTQNRAQITALLQSDLAQRVCREAETATGTVILNLCDAGGYRQLSNDVRPVTCPKDLEGLTIRTNGMAVCNIFFESLGAKTVSVAYQDLYTALDSGVADGQDNPWINSKESKVYEVQKYFTELNYQFHPDPFYVNAAWWNDLPQVFQTALKTCAKDMGSYNDRIIDANCEEARMAIAASGAQVYIPSEEEMQAFRDAMEPVYDQCVARGICTAEEIAEMQAVVAQVG